MKFLQAFQPPRLRPKGGSKTPAGRWAWAHCGGRGEAVVWLLCGSCRACHLLTFALLQYEAYTEDQRYQLQQTMKKWLANEIEELEVVNLRQVKEYFRPGGVTILNSIALTPPGSIAGEGVLHSVQGLHQKLGVERGGAPPPSLPPPHLSRAAPPRPSAGALPCPPLPSPAFPCPPLPSPACGPHHTAAQRSGGAHSFTHPSWTRAGTAHHPLNPPLLIHPFHPSFSRAVRR